MRKINQFIFAFLIVSRLVHAQEAFYPPFDWNLMSRVIIKGMRLNLDDFRSVAPTVGMDPLDLFYENITLPKHKKIGAFVWLIKLNKTDHDYDGYYVDIIYGPKKAFLFGGIVPAKLPGLNSFVQFDKFYSVWIENNKKFNVFVRRQVDTAKYENLVIFSCQIISSNNNDWIIINDKTGKLIALQKMSGANEQYPEYDGYLSEMVPEGPFAKDVIRYPFSRLKFLYRWNDYGHSQP